MTISTLPITGLPVGEVSPNVIVCGDPARAGRIAERLDEPALISHNREYQAHRGTYGGTPITVCSHGIGAPGAAIAFEELIAAGARAIIRVGTCGGLQPDVHAGHLIVVEAAVQNIGYAREVAPDGFPAAADGGLTLALWQKVSGERGPVADEARKGIVLSRDAFYPGVAGPAAPDYNVMSQAGVLAVEMECAALFLVCAMRKVASAAVLAVDGNVLDTTESFETYSPGTDTVQRAVDRAIHAALEALVTWE